MRPPPPAGFEKRERDRWARRAKEGPFSVWTQSQNASKSRSLFATRAVYSNITALENNSSLARDEAP